MPLLLCVNLDAQGKQDRAALEPFTEEVTGPGNGDSPWPVQAGIYSRIAPWGHSPQYPFCWSHIWISPLDDLSDCVPISGCPSRAGIPVSPHRRRHSLDVICLFGSNHPYGWEVVSHCVMVSIWIFLTADTEYLFMCLWVVCTFLDKCLLRSLTFFLVGLFVFIFLSLEFLLYSRYILSQICDCKDSSPIRWVVFSLFKKLGCSFRCKM